MVPIPSPKPQSTQPVEDVPVSAPAEVPVQFQLPLASPPPPPDAVDELLLNDASLLLDQQSPSDSLNGAIFDDTNWLNGMQTLPLTPRSQALQLARHSAQEAAANDEADDIVEITRMTDVASQNPLYGPEMSSTLGMDTFDTSMFPGFDNPVPNSPEVPLMMYCSMPWPNDIMASASRRLLWQHFLHVSRTGFLCLDNKHVEHMQDFQDPFVASLVQMALFDDDVRTVVIYFSAYQYQAATNQPKFMTLMNQTARDASRAITVHGSSSDLDHQKLLAKFSIALFLHLYGPDPREIYLQVASTFAVTFLRGFEQGKRALAMPARLILALLRWARISILCSLRQPETYLGQSIYGTLEMDEEEINQNFGSNFQDWPSHPIYAFSPRLINPLLRLGQLLELRQTRYALTGVLEPLGPALEPQVAELEGAILNARERYLLSTRTRDPDPLDHLNEAMHSSALVLLYSRLRGMPSTSPLVRHHVTNIVDSIVSIDPDSRVYYAIIFPLFTAGCDAVDMATRNVIERRLEIRKGLFYNRGDLVGALRHIWSIRDLEPGLSWLEWLRRGKSLNVFLFLIVRGLTRTQSTLNIEFGVYSSAL